MTVIKETSCVKKLKNRSGFTLLELAVVLTVVTFLVSNLALGFHAGVNAYRLKKNRERIEIVKQAVNTYFAKNMRLPCPSNPFLDSKDTNFGQENLYRAVVNGEEHSECWLQLSRQGSQDVSGSNTPPVAIKTSGDINPEYALFGGVPVRELGLTPEMAFDMYGNAITYVVPSFMTMYSRSGYMKASNSVFTAQSNTTYHKIAEIGYARYGEYVEKISNSTGGIRWKDNYILFTIPDSNSGDNIDEYRVFYPFHMIIKDIESRSISDTEYNVAFVLVSHGENGYGSWQKGGLIKPFPENNTSLEKNNSYAGIIEKICPLKSNCDVKSINSPHGIEFFTGSKKDQSDDIVRYSTVSNLIKDNGLEKIVYCNLTSINEDTRLLHSELQTSTNNNYIMGMSRPNKTTAAGTFIKQNTTFSHNATKYICIPMGNIYNATDGQEVTVN